MGGKRKPALDPRQIGFTFEAPIPPRRASDLAGLERQVSSAVGFAIKHDPRSREEIAGAISALLGEEVTRWMLDSWSAESKNQHAISAARLMALIAVTNRFDLLDALVRRVGASLLVGEEIHVARLGDIDRRIADLRAERNTLQKYATPLGRAQ